MPVLPKIIIYATCQGEYLRGFLECSEALTRRFELVYLSNISRPGVFCAAEIDVDTVRTCVLFLYHKVRSPRNREAVQKMVDMLPGGALAVPLPYITSNLYWPLFDSVLNPLGGSEEKPLGCFPYRLSLLDTWAKQGLPEAEMARRFQEFDSVGFQDQRALYKSTCGYWESLDREGEGYLRVADFLKEHWNKQLLFYLYNHPARPVFLHLANQVLRILGLPLLNQEQVRKVPCAQNSIYPVDPALGRYWKLKFAREHSRYPYHDALFSYRMFIEKYIRVACALERSAGLPIH